MNAFVLTSPLAGVMLLTRRQPFYPSAAHDKFFSICTAFGGYTEFGIVPCFAWVIFVGASAAYKRSLHGGIDLLVRLFPEKVRKFVSMLSTILILIICIALTLLSYQYAVGSGSKVTPVLYISYFWVDLSAVVGFALMCIHSLFFLKNLFIHKDYYRSMPLYAGILNYDTVMGGVSEDEELKLHVDTAEDKEKGADN